MHVCHRRKTTTRSLFGHSSVEHIDNAGVVVKWMDGLTWLCCLIL